MLRDFSTPRTARKAAAFDHCKADPHPFSRRSYAPDVCHARQKERERVCDSKVTICGAEIFEQMKGIE